MKHWVHLSSQPIDIAAAYAFLQTPEAGGIAIFVGTTRQWTKGQETLSLMYESYQPMAVREMNRLISMASTRWPISRVCLLHRLGEVPLTESSVFVGVATPHRNEAFEACRFLIDQVKVQVPIWKQEKRSDGKDVWVEGSEIPNIFNPEEHEGFVPLDLDANRE